MRYQDKTQEVALFFMQSSRLSWLLLYNLEKQVVRKEEGRISCSLWPLLTVVRSTGIG